MAKKRPVYAPPERERQLGYTIDSLNYPSDANQRFYSDLRPLPESPDERGRREVEAKQNDQEHNPTRDESLAEMVVPQTITDGYHAMTFARRSHVGLYNFTADVHFGFGLDLFLLLTKDEIEMAISTSQLQPNSICGLGPMFSRLPKEIRRQIYDLAIPQRVWRSRPIDKPGRHFLQGIGDPGGFSFPLSSLSILRVNKQMSEEALPLAYRSTTFRLDDMDDLIELLIGIGDIGRGNIGSLEFSWQSNSDEELWLTEQLSTQLPVLHVARCARLLEQCKNLKFLRLYLDADLISRYSVDTLMADPGLRGLRSVRGIKKIEIYGLDCEPLDNPEFVTWLKEAMQSPPKGRVGVIH